MAFTDPSARTSGQSGVRSPVKGQTQQGSHSPKAAVARVTFEVQLTKICNINVNKFRDVGEWTMLAKLFTISAGEKCIAVSDQVVVTSLVVDLKLKMTAKIDLNTFGDIDALVHYPLVLNFYEVELIAKEKKKQAPEERTELVGQALVDLLPLVLGKKEVQRNLPVFTFGKTGAEADDKSSVSGAMNAAEESRVDLVVTSLADQLIPPEITSSFNILLLRLEGFFRMPETFIINASASVSSTSYGIITSLPSTASNERYLIINSKNVQAQPECLEPRFVKWPAHYSYISESVGMTAATSIDLQTGIEPNDKPNYAFLPSFTEFRCVISAEAADCLKARITSTGIWPIEICNLVVPERHVSTKRKQADNVGSMEDAVIMKHGVAYVDVASLLEPGSRGIRGKYPVQAFQPQEFTDKVQRKSAAIEIFGPTALPPVVVEHEKSGSGTAKKTPEGTPASITQRKSAVHVHTPPLDPNAPPPVSQDELDKQLYEAYGTYVSVVICLEKPLVRKREDDFHGFDLSATIPKRPKTLYPNDDGKFAAQQLRNEVSRFHELVCSLYKREMLNYSDWITIVKNIEAELEKTGEMYIVKNRLCNLVLQIVRDRHCRGKAFDDKADYEQFIVKLRDEISREITNALPPHLEANLEIVEEPNPSLHLKVLALECEIENDLAKAEDYLIKRTELPECSPGTWVDLGLFQLKYRKYAEAIKSFAQFLRTNWNNADGLIMFGYSFFESGETTKAQVLFETVTVLQPKSPIAWTVLGAFYDCLPNDPTGATDLLKERAYYEANALLEKNEEKLKEQRANLRFLERTCASNLPDYPTGQAAVERAYRMMEDILFPCPIVPNKSKVLYDISEENILFPPKHSLKLHDNKMARKRSHAYPQQKNIFYYCLPYFASFGLYRFGTLSICSLVGVGVSKDHVYWKSVVILLLQRELYDEAEKILQDVLSVETPDLFMYYGHVHFARKNYDSAAYLYDQAISGGIQLFDKYPLFYRYGLLATVQENFAKAKEMYFSAAKLHETCKSWLGCGVASFKLGDMINAEYAMERANSQDDSNPLVWGYLTMIARLTGRTELTEKNYVTAVLCGLKIHQDLFDEVKRSRSNGT